MSQGPDIVLNVTIDVTKAARECLYFYTSLAYSGPCRPPVPEHASGMEKKFN
jgi:hypothetical protein